MSTEIHVTELLPAHSLDCLDDEDIVLVSEHLAVCDDCPSELRAYQTVVDDLALAMPTREPPPDLRPRLMDRVEPPHLTASVGPRTSGWEPLTGLMRRSVPAWGVVSLVVVAVLVIGSLWLGEGLGGPGDATEPGVLRTINLTSTEAAPEATGLLVVSLDGEHGTLVVDGLAPLGEEQQYQLWLIQDGRRTSGGVFSVSEEGYGSLWISSPEPLSSYSAFGITIEPAGGGPGPSGDRVLGSAL